MFYFESNFGKLSGGPRNGADSSHMFLSHVVWFNKLEVGENTPPRLDQVICLLAQVTIPNEQQTEIIIVTKGKRFGIR